LKLLARSEDLPDSPRHISVTQPYVYITTKDKSHVVYEVQRDEHSDTDEYKIRKYFGDAQNRPTVSHAVLNLPAGFHGETEETERIIVLVDLNSQLSILRQPSSAPLEIGARPILSAKLPRMISRLEATPFQPPWLVNTNGPHNFPDILGTSPSGVVMHLRLLPEAPAKLLVFLMRLIEYTKQGKEKRRKPGIVQVCLDPDRPKYPPQYAGATSSAANSNASMLVGDKNSDLVINANVMRPIFYKKHAKSEVINMLLHPSWEESLQDGVNTNEDRADQVQDRIALFLELVQGVKDYNDTRMDSVTIRVNQMQLENGHEDLNSAVAFCIEWVRKMLDNVL
jgi:hypothetical protein